MFLHFSTDFEKVLTRHLKLDQLFYHHFYELKYEDFRKLLGGRVHFSESQEPGYYKVKLAISITQSRDSQMALLSVQRLPIHRDDLPLAISPRELVDKALPKVLLRMLRENHLRMALTSSPPGLRLSYAPLPDIKHAFLGFEIHPAFNEIQLHVQLNLGESYQLLDRDNRPAELLAPLQDQGQVRYFNTQSAIQQAQLLGNANKEESWVNLKVPTSHYQALGDVAKARNIDIHVLVQEILAQAAKQALPQPAAEIPRDPSVLRDDDLDHHPV